jgi:hypothetical protein
MAAAACIFAIFVLLEVRRAVRPRETVRAAFYAPPRRCATISRPTHLTIVTDRSDRSTERRPVSPIPFICHTCGADFSLATRVLALIDCELYCPECGSPAVQADLLYPHGYGPRLIDEPEAEAS